MGDLTRIRADDIVVGEEILWDVFDSQDKLLLRKGTRIESQHQLDALMERGMFLHGNGRGGWENEGKPEVEALSPFDLIDAAQLRLERLFGRIGSEPDFPLRVLEIAGAIQQAVARDVEASLGRLLIDGHPRYAIRHSMHAALICEVIAKYQGKPEEERLPMLAGALTMNVAMLQLQDQLQSRREPLTAAQREEVRRHPALAVEMLKAAGVADPVWLDGVLHHHECLDGSGYPQGLKGSEISYVAQLICLADIYDARISTRDYRPAKPPGQALKEIFLSRGQRVNPTLASILIKELGIYPPGCFLLLANGEIAVSIRRGDGPQTPIVQSVVGPRNNLLSIPIRRNTAKPEFAIKDIVSQEQASVKVNCDRLWGYRSD